MELRIRNLSFAYPNRKDVPILDRVSLDIRSGELIALLGPSGCGKSTLLRCIAGFHEPTAGDILLGSESILAVPPEKRNLGMAFQHYALFPHMTVAENVGFGMKMRRWDKARIDKRVAEMLELVRMGGYERSYPRQLSGGQQQRVALARALAPQPAVLLLDEPLSNLDAGLRIELRSEIARIQKTLGITAVYVTHDREEALAISDRVAVLKQGGVLVQVAAPREIYAAPASRFVAEFLGRRSLVRGRVSAASGDVVRVAADGYEFEGRPLGALSVGESAWVGLRPEDIRPQTGEGPHLAVKIDVVDFAGSILRFSGTTASGQTVHAEMLPEAPGADGIRHGSDLRLLVAGNHKTVVYPADSP